MAIHNPPDLYTAGNVVLDSSPTTQLYGQILQRKRAKQDALDEYDRQRINHINDQGVRDKDREGFDNRLQGIRDYYNSNKDKIRKGNSAEAYEYEKKFRYVSGYVNQSKERTAKQDAAMKFYQDKLKQDGVVPDDFMTELHLNDSGLDEEGSRTFDLTKWLSSPKPFNQQTFLKEFGDVKRTPSVRTEKIPDQPLRLNEITEETFDVGGKQTIAARAANKYENSYSFREQVKSEMKDPVARQRMDQTFKEQFGTMPALPEDYATAFTLEILQPKITKTKAVDYKSDIMTRREKFAREIQNRIDNRSFGLANLRRSWQQADQKAQDEYLDDIILGYQKAGKIDPKVVDDYQRSDRKGHKVPIDQQVFNPNGTVDFIVYKLDDDGNTTTEVDEAYTTRNVPMTQIKARTRKELETQMTNTNAQPNKTPATKKPTKPRPY